ncbi:MAG: RNA polymerase sigma factor RpoD/SigA [bacterium]|nr:RNA polymerase sigma factor RpoD/SigA [bacterium]
MIQLLKIVISKNIKLLSTGKDALLDNEIISLLVEIYCSENDIILYEYDAEYFEKNESISDIYIKEIKINESKTRTLSKDEEIALFERYNNNKDLSAKEEIINHNLRLVVSIAKKYNVAGFDFLDIVQEGNLGLIKAIDKFDLSKGYKFSTYATFWIKQSITRGICDKSRNIRVPVHTLEMINKYRKDKERIEIEYGKKLNELELSKHLKLPIEKIYKFEMLLDDTTSLDYQIGDEKDTTLADYIPDSCKSVEDECCDSISDYIYKMLDDNRLGLTNTEKNVIIGRFGFYDGKAKTLQELGTQFGVTRERIRQVEMRALRKIKKSRYYEELSQIVGCHIMSNVEPENKVLVYKRKKNN